MLEQMVFDRNEHVACAVLQALVELDPDNATARLVNVLNFSPLCDCSRSPHSWLKPGQRRIWQQMMQAKKIHRNWWTW